MTEATVRSENRKHRAIWIKNAVSHFFSDHLHRRFSVARRLRARSTESLVVAPREHFSVVLASRALFAVLQTKLPGHATYASSRICSLLANKSPWQLHSIGPASTLLGLTSSTTQAARLPHTRSSSLFRSWRRHFHAQPFASIPIGISRLSHRADSLDGNARFDMPAFGTLILCVTVCPHTNHVPAFILLFGIKEPERDRIQSHEIAVCANAARADLGFDVLRTDGWVRLAIDHHFDGLIAA